MDGDNNNGGNLALTEQGEAALAAKPEIVVPNLSNTKRFDCGNGRSCTVRVAGMMTKADIAVDAGGYTGKYEPAFNMHCARWGITSLQGDWGKGPGDKPWAKVQSSLGPIQPKELIDTIPEHIVGEISAYVQYGAYVTEVQGKD